MNKVDYGQHLHYFKGVPIENMPEEMPEPSIKEQRRAARQEKNERARKAEKRRRIIADKSRRANRGT